MVMSLSALMGISIFYGNTEIEESFTFGDLEIENEATLSVKEVRFGEAEGRIWECPQRE